MAIVRLARDWFAPNAHLFRADPKGTSIPDELCGKNPDTGAYRFLPKGSKVLSLDTPTVAVEPPAVDVNPKQVAFDQDPDRAQVLAEKKALEQRSADASAKPAGEKDADTSEAERRADLAAALERVQKAEKPAKGGK